MRRRRLSPLVRGAISILPLESDRRERQSCSGARLVDAGEMLISSLYNFIICLVAAALYVVVDAHEPNRRLASALKRAIVAVAVAAILGHLKG
jgi:hypothetical protein